MLANSLRIRGVKFAYVWGPPRLVGREEASRIHGAVCDELGYDDISFLYSTPSTPDKPESKGFAITLKRDEGRGSFAVRMANNAIDQPTTLLLEYTWPPSLEHVKQLFDMIVDAVFSALEGERHLVVAEVRLRAQCNTRDNDGIGFFKSNFLKGSGEWISTLGKPLSFCGLRLDIDPLPPGDDPLHGAKREVTIESLREDPRDIYLELMSQWPQVCPVPRSAGQQIDLTSLRQIGERPSVYVENADRYLRELAEYPGSAQEENADA